MTETEYDLIQIKRFYPISPVIIQFARFLIIGILNTAVDLITLNLMVVMFSIHGSIGFAVIKSCSFLTAVVFSYFLNKTWTFNDISKERHIRKMSHFLVISLAGMIINVAAATFVITFLKHPISNLFPTSLLTEKVWVNLGALSGSAAGLLWNFTGYKFFVFEKQNLNN